MRLARVKRAKCTIFFFTALAIGVCYFSIDMYIYSQRIYSALSPYDTYIAGRVMQIRKCSREYYFRE